MGSRSTAAALLLVLLAGAPAHAAPARGAPTQGAPTQGAPTQGAPTHAEWTAVLHKYVREGKVDYRGLKEHSAVLDTYLRALVSVKKDELAAMPRAGQLAFFINAYNAYTVRLILDHFPVDSIRSIGLLPGAAFRQSFIPLAGEQLSLNQIEDRLRAMNEPRIHFAIVCASKSCPALKDEAYTAARIEEELDAAARRFVRDPAKNRFDPKSRVFQASSIFKWYRGDFERAAGSLERYLALYATAPAAEALRRGGVRVEFLDYDWALNGQ